MSAHQSEMDAIQTDGSLHLQMLASESKGSMDEPTDKRDVLPSGIVASCVNFPSDALELLHKNNDSTNVKVDTEIGKSQDQWVSRTRHLSDKQPQLWLSLV